MKIINFEIRGTCYMLQKTYIIGRDNFTDAICSISSLLYKLEASSRTIRPVLFVFPEIYAQNELEYILERAHDALPGVQIFGVTNHNITYNHEPDDDSAKIILSLICFEKSTSGCDFVLSDLSEAPEYVASKQVINRLKLIKKAKGIFLFSSGLDARTNLYMQNIHENFPLLPIFGLSAATQSPTIQTAYIFANGKIISTGFLAIIFYGKELEILTDEVFGWTPLGKKMTITKMCDSSEKIVSEIDNKPAVDIYTKYLGLLPEQVNMDNACEFPIVKEAGARIAGRICVRAFPDGSVNFGAPLKLGDEFRLTYGNPHEIFKTSARHANFVANFFPQALFLIGCMNRVIFLGEEQEREVNYFRKAHSELAVLHGNSELFFDKDGGSEINSTIVYIALREGKLPETAKSGQESLPQIQVIENNTHHKRVPLMRRLLTFLDVTTSELEDLQANLYEEVNRKTQEIILQQQKLNEINKHIVLTLSNTIDAKDTYTNGHSRRVAEYAREISRRYGYDEAEQEKVYMIGLLHDVGKIGIPDAIINKPGKLTNEEYEIIKTHPAIGAEILKNITEIPELSYGAHWHHERYDGKGYPDKLRGEEIPEIAQIISVADAYDAMTSRRSYRTVMLQNKVREEIANGLGTQFAPRFAEIMLAMIDEDINYIMRGDLLAS